MRRKKTETITAEQAMKNKLNNLLFHLPFCPNPTYWFGIGDGVEIGNLDDCVIVDIFENGKYYEVEYTSVNNNYGKPISSTQRGYWFWHEIRPLSYRFGEDLIQNKDLQITFSARNLGDALLGAYYSFGISMNPFYQRDLVWTEEDDVKLIHSIFHGIDIGKFVFVKLPFAHNEPSYEVLDGKQRLSAIIRFYENRYSYKGYFYNDLSHREKHHFTEKMISYAALDENTTFEQKLRYFLKLNTSGKAMSEEHLRKVSKMLNEE